MKKYTLLLLTLVMSGSLLGCSQQSSPASTNETSSPTTAETNAAATTNNETGQTEQTTPTAKQGETATDEQVQAATDVAKQYKQAEYQVTDYSKLNLDTNNEESLNEASLPEVSQQQYDRLEPYASAEFLSKQAMSRVLILPQRLATQSQSNVTTTDLKLTADPVFKVKGIMEIAYEMNIAVGDKEKIPSKGTLQLQQVSGEWKVINDAYDQAQLAQLLDRVNGNSSS
ncbi:hypothetical protein ACE3MZ_02450 [Paenibacillus sp. WLX1005]|uniref:hypothetical protein n=1 Tax=Paenibacillus sp. WLX1005 TaxID=3243766 RepID=UPI003983FA77